MTRKEKIKALQAISEGKIRIEDLEPPQIYIFIETSRNPGVYKLNGKLYTEIEYQQFKEKIERKNNDSIIWNEGKEYPKEDTIITIHYEDNDTNSSGQKSTLDLSK